MMLRLATWLAAVATLSFAMGCSDDAAAPVPEEGESIQALPQATAVQPGSPSGADAVARETVLMAEATLPLQMTMTNEKGYVDADGRLIVDVVQDDSVYFQLEVTDAEGRWVAGAEPKIETRGTSLVRSLYGQGPKTNSKGGLRFGVIAGEMGEDQVAVRVQDAEAHALLNVIDRAANNYINLAESQGALSWELLKQATTRWDDSDHLISNFPPDVQAKNGSVVKLAGFIMPLQTAEMQSELVLTSSPPNCFFHMPGGPAGAVEVFMRKAIPVQWEPVVLEGRLEVVAKSAIGVPYRLRDATLVKVVTDDADE